MRLSGREAEMLGVEPDAERRRAAASADLLAVGADELWPGSSSTGGRRCRRPLPRRRAARGSRRGRRRRRARVRSRRTRASCLPLTTASVLDVRLGEDAVERLLERVRQDVGAADHRDAENDGESGQERCGSCDRRGPRSVTPIIAAVTSSIAAMISCAEDCPRSLTIRPSARKRTRSAISRRVCVVRDHDGRLAEARRPSRGGARGSRRSSSSRGCRWARRRT